MKINVTHNGTDVYIGPTGKQIAVNSITAEINGKKYELPRIIPNGIELQYSEDSKIKLDDSIFLSVHRVGDISAIRQAAVRAGILQKAKTLLQKRPASIGHLHFQYPQDNILRMSDRELIHEIQANAGASIISDYELDREQDENIFESHILQLRRDYSKHIVCPTIDIGMKTENLFGKKVDKILSNGFVKFNVIYRSMTNNPENWLDLSLKLLGRSVWCNVVGVAPRWQRTSKASNLVRVLNFGAHTVSLGYPWQSSVNVPSYNLNGNTLCYELVHGGMTYPESRAASINTHQQQLALMRRHVIGKSYFTKYVPSRIGLLSHVQSIVA